MDNQSSKKSSLSNVTIYTYALGEFGFTFFLMFVAYYLMYFLTDVAKLPVALAAVLYTTVQWFEAITVVISGVVMDRVKFKMGKFRPWIVMGSIACLIGTTVFFTKWDISAAAYTIVFPLFYLIAYWGYNFMWVAYRALNGVIGKLPQETVSLTVSGSQLGTLSSLIFSFVGVKILYGFSSIETGYTISALLYGVLMVLGMLIVFRVAKPYDIQLMSVEHEQSKVETKKISLKDTLSSLKGPTIPYFISTVMRSSVAAAVPALMTYHFKYVIGDPGGISTYMICVTFAQLIGTFLVRYMANKFGKLKMYYVSTFMATVFLVLAYFLSNNQFTFTACMTLFSFSNIFGGSLVPAFMNDIADYNEFELGLDVRAFSYSIGATAIRVASIVGGAIASFGLAAIGYDGSLAVQPDSVINGIRLIMTLGAAAVMLSSAIPMIFYKLDEKRMAPIYERKAAMYDSERKALSEAEAID